MCVLRQWHPTLVLLPGKSRARRSLVGCSPWGREELDTTERLHFHFSVSYTGEGNGNPLQCSCLENPRGRGAWWEAVSGVAQSQTRLKRLSSSSSSSWNYMFFSTVCCCRFLCDIYTEVLSAALVTDQTCLKTGGKGESDSKSRLVVPDSVTPWTVASQAPLSMGFSRPEYWSG